MPISDCGTCVPGTAWAGVKLHRKPPVAPDDPTLGHMLHGLSCTAPATGASDTQGIFTTAHTDPSLNFVYTLF